MLSQNRNGDLKCNNDSIECDTISTLVMQGIQTICLNGTFVNMTETILLPENSQVVIYGKNAILQDMTLLVSGDDPGDMGKILFVEIEFQNSILKVSHASVQFISCHLYQAIVRNFNSSDLNRNMEHIHIAIEQCSMICRESGLPGGIILQHKSIINLSIRDSMFDSCRVDIEASELLLQVIKSILLETTIQLSAKSFLRVPSIIVLSETRIVHHKQGDIASRILLDLDNPYASLNNCRFEGTSLEIVSQNQ